MQACALRKAVYGPGSYCGFWSLVFEKPPQRIPQWDPWTPLQRASTCQRTSPMKERSSTFDRERG